MMAKQTKTPPIRTLTAHEALSWGMFGDETKITPSSILGIGANLPAPHRSHAAALSELRCAIAQGIVKARGFRVDQNMPPLERVPIMPDLFVQFPALAVDAFGETTFMHPASPQKIPQWRDIIFVEDEIHALWPKPRPDLDQWMMDSVSNRPDEKRDSRIGDCQKANGCTFREAKAAYGRLPPNMKRGRGQRIKPPGDAK